MIWVGSFKSLQSAMHKPRFGAPLEVHTWLRSEIDRFSPFDGAIYAFGRTKIACPR
jgi:hypothetical protein